MADKNKPERSNTDGHWDEFADWCKENFVSLDQHDDWETWWACWNAALDARESYQVDLNME